MGEGFQIKIDKGQGLTQALKKYAQEQKEAGNAEISDGIFTKEEWSATIGKLKDIQAERQKNGETSIFTGGTGNNWKKDMIVQEGEIEFSESEMKQLMGAMGVTTKKKQTTASIDNKPAPLEVPKPEIKPMDVKLNEIKIAELPPTQGATVKMKNVKIRVEGEKVDAVRVKDHKGKRYYQRTENNEIGEQVAKDKPRIVRWFSKDKTKYNNNVMAKLQDKEEMQEIKMYVDGKKQTVLYKNGQFKVIDPKYPGQLIDVTSKVKPNK